MPRNAIFLELRSEVKVTVTLKQYVTLRDRKVYQHIEFGIPTSNNIGDMLPTQIRLGRTDGPTVQKLYDPKAYFGGIKKGLDTKIYCTPYLT